MQTEESLPPALYVVGTPIGNRAELSPRAADILSRVDTIACEDTRHTRRILPVDAKAPLIPCHEHNETAVAPALAERVARGERVALVTDAGMPAVSDPGFRVVRACRARGLTVTPVSGPCALVNALAVSGLPTDAFLFLGFLPPKSTARRRIFAEHADAPHTLVFYESTHRILKTLADIEETLGKDRYICVARELTKRHETIVTAPAAEAREAVARGSQKGEFVVLIAKRDYVL
ncbi:MAG: 16S rRNA (cytidine(1402)-2'-O)-methyltransferase [Opitutales bacterium]|nr:16S rRNA (cytidine(1402)-2'-O)-methyltransferase [Opitutales bacterium]